MASRGGLEGPPEFQSGVSTNSTIRAGPRSYGIAGLFLPLTCVSGLWQALVCTFERRPDAGSSAEYNSHDPGEGSLLEPRRIGGTSFSARRCKARHHIPRPGTYMGAETMTSTFRLTSIALIFREL